MNTTKAKQVKIETATIEAAAHDSGMTPAQYVAWHHAFFGGKPMTAEKIGTEDGGRVTVFELRPTKATKVQAAFGCRRHTRAQLTRARAALADMTTTEQATFKRLAAKYGVTPAQVVANAAKIVNAPNGSSSDTCGLRPATPAEARAAARRLAAKYGVTVEQVWRGDMLAHNRLHRGRGQLYRADILGEGVQA